MRDTDTNFVGYLIDVHLSFQIQKDLTFHLNEHGFIYFLSALEGPKEEKGQGSTVTHKCAHKSENHKSVDVRFGQNKLQKSTVRLR